MELKCEWCGKPVSPAQSGQPICSRCRDREHEYERRWEEVVKAGGTWNPSQDDPWLRDWLISRELFAVYHEVIPSAGTPIHSLLGGTVFEYETPGCRVEVWVAPGEVVVAYPITGMWIYKNPKLEWTALPEFACWIDHLRNSEPLEVGKVRGRSSYGAIWPRCSALAPAVKWAQYGDWAAMARGLHSEGECR